MKTSITKWPKIMPVLDSFPFASENYYYYYFHFGDAKTKLHRCSQFEGKKAQI